MALTQRMLESLAEWCAECSDFADERRECWRHFFGDDDERPVDYPPGTGDARARNRRALGYFMFKWLLPSGETPVEVAVQTLLDGPGHSAARSSVAQARYVWTAVKTIGARSVWLQMKDEAFEVSYPGWSQAFPRGTAVAAHLVPAGFGRWLVGPGWIHMPIQFGEGILSNLDELQMDPIAIERLLQGRSASPVHGHSTDQDDNLDAAVARLTAWARQHAFETLVRSPASWQELMVSYLDNTPGAYLQPVIEALERAPAMAEAEELLPLLANIWNNTPQPNRGGKTAREQFMAKPRPKERS